MNDAGSENHFNTITVEGRRLNFEGEFQRRQDGNYNGSFLRYVRHMEALRDRIEESFSFTR